ncbi:hypothetical protein GQ44DRAFT_702409 [Phaeosphaeriaceae sp. PMI808]|nr:hypothetical protein GQ44DRAFT_702409 [Phaeosphaeriaceae sp. PMI808]
MPTFLSTIGLSIAEISLVSFHRPLLAFLITMGAPAMWPSRLLEYSDPTCVLGDSSGNNARGSLLVVRIGDQWKWAAGLLSALQYVLAAGAVFNVVWTSLDLGWKSILSWGCTTTIGPLLWSSLTCIVHIAVVMSFAYARKSAVKQTKVTGAVKGDMTSGGSCSPSSIFRNVWGPMKKEGTLCAEQRLEDEYEVDSRVLAWAVIGNVLAGCGFVHLVFGAIIFSSL